MSDFSALSAAQRKAAEILALDDENKYTLAQVASEVGVDVSTLYRWRQDETFIAYKNSVADRAMDDFLSDAYKILKGIAGNGLTERSKLKALELVLKNRGKLQDVAKVETVIEDKRTNDTIEAEIKRLEQQIEALDK